MKTYECYGCQIEIQVDDDYEPKYCCSGYMCGCMGSPINPVFCDECEKNIFGRQNDV